MSPFMMMNASAQETSGLHSPVFGALALSQGNAFAARADDASVMNSGFLWADVNNRNTYPIPYSTFFLLF